MAITNAPVQQKERAVVVDTLRGFALVGVLIANFTGYTSEQVPAEILDAISSPFDKLLVDVNSVFFEWKFMTLFSILFGYGFGLILTSLEKKNIHPDGFFIRRMFWLFIIGCIHTSFWWFDVLHFYAISGVFLLFFKKASNKTILICSVLFMFVVPLCFSFIMRNQPETFGNAEYRDAYYQFKNGSLFDVFKTNLAGYYKLYILSLSDIHDVIETLGRFLFGYFLLRIRFFEAIATKRKLFTNVIFITAPVMITYFIIRWMALRGHIALDMFYWKPLIRIGIFSTTCLYASSIVLLFISFSQSALLKALQALGKMTLTNYLLISAIMITILYGIGFGKLGELPMHTIWLLALIWLIIEILFSAFWLSSFRYGPFEWIWRQLTYRKILPLRK